MINSVASATRTISSIYAANGQELVSVMAKIASGRRYVNPGDDFVAFVRANNFENEIRSYDLARTSIGAAKVYTDAAQGVGGKIYKNLARMAQLQADYPGANATAQTAMSAEYDALKAETINVWNNAAIDATNLVQGGNLISFNTGGTSGNTLTVTAAAITDPNGLGDVTAADASAAATSALTYLSTINGWAKTIDSLASLTDTIIASKQAAIEEVAGINEAEMLAKVTDLQVRQQASISMLAQASMSGQRIAYLFGGG